MRHPLNRHPWLYRGRVRSDPSPGVFLCATHQGNGQAQRLYLFRGHDRSARQSWRIAPDNYINDTLIRENWDDLLRLVATIKLKENTTSDIFRRLNSYSRQHALYQTLKAFGQIIKSDFILRYVDDVDLRQAIEKQLNKVGLNPIKVRNHQ